MHRLQRTSSPDLRLEPRGLDLPDLGATSESPCAYPGPSCTTAGASWVRGQLKSSARPRAGAAGSPPRRRASEGGGRAAPRSASPLTGGASVSGTTGPAIGRSLGRRAGLAAGRVRELARKSATNFPLSSSVGLWRPHHGRSARTAHRFAVNCKREGLL